jgi:2,4-dienoyl-CoA reductase-like NADH-dependent reductase (Old Yellow Enzyme family)
MKHFHFKTLDELARRADKLGASHVAFEHDPERVKALLARKQRVADHTVGNSIAIHPMEGCDAAPDGRPGDLTRRRYERFAAGGAKLIWFESTAIRGDARSSLRQLWLCPETMPDFAKLLEAVRRAHRRQFGGAGDLLEVLQLTHPGRYSAPRRVVAARNPALDRKTGVAADHPLISDDEIEQIEDQYVEAARLAVEAGFHAIDIKACSGSLAHELLSARQRAGRYGGPLENRARFLKNVIGKIRDDAGGPLVIAVRLGCYDGIPYAAAPDGSGAPLEHPIPYPYGFGVDPNDPLREDLTEVKQVVEWLEAWDVALLGVTVGFGAANPHVGRPYERRAEGDYEQPEHPLLGVDRHFRIAGALQQAYPELPMTGAGYSWLREYMINAAAGNIGQGNIRFFGAGRNAIAYPEFARDALEKGALDRSRVCLTDGDCICLMRSDTPPLGQFPAGCASHDKRLYGSLLRSARKAAKKG